MLLGRELGPWKCRWCEWYADVGVAAPTEELPLAGAVIDDARVLPIMLAGGIAIVLELVSTVRPDTTVALVDWIE